MNTPLSEDKKVWRCFHCDDVFTSVVDAHRYKEKAT